MILKIILKKKEVKPQASSCKPVDNLKKDLTYVGFSYIHILTHLLQMQLRTGGN